MTSKPFTTCLWFDTQGEEAAHYYMGIFKDSSLGRVQRYTSAGPGAEGTVATVEFELNGQKFLALNGGPQCRSSSSAPTRPRSTTTGTG
jgi:predicted 3-demethylubiquinone-9 3-methyltransferase (glyoxalase superfamily)